MPEYKLIYFNGRGRAELTRWIFAYGDIPYVDERIEKADWPAMKKTLPGGKLPVLMIDGKPLPQSLAMARYVAKEVGLIPEDKLESAYCDAMIDAITDIRTELFRVSLIQDEEERKKEYKEVYANTAETVLAGLQMRLHDNDWLNGDKITWVDLVCGLYLGEIVQKKPGFLDGYAPVAAHIKKIQELPKIAAWISKSPKTDF